MHESSLFDFINHPGWGYVRDRDHVAGFQPHHFRRMPVLPIAESAGRHAGGGFSPAAAIERGHGAETVTADQQWEIGKLQLVSLLKHAEPTVYVSDELPRMDRLTEVPVRPLDRFEPSSLVRLERGEGVVSDSDDDNRLRVLGAIRAAEKCLRCHTVDRGELLGAFSYRIDRTRPIRRKTPHPPASAPPGA